MFKKNLMFLILRIIQLGILLCILIQSSCFFRTVTESEVILQSKTLSETEKIEDEFRFNFSASLQKEYLEISISNLKEHHSYILAKVHEEYKPNLKIQVNTSENKKSMDECLSNFSGINIACYPVFSILILAEGMFIPLRLISFPEERIQMKNIDMGIVKIEKMEIQESLTLKTEFLEGKNQKQYPIKNGLVLLPKAELVFAEEYVKPLLKIKLFDTQINTNVYGGFIDLSAELEKNPEINKLRNKNRL